MPTPDQHHPEEPQRFALRSLAGLGGVVLVGVLFTLVLALVATRWPALRTADAAVVDALNDTVSGSSWAVSALHLLTDLGGAQAAWLVCSVLVVWLLVRRAPRLATYAAVTGLGAAVLSNGVKALVGRLRPVVDVAIASAPGASFPSGHALGSTVTYGLLLLVFLPVVPTRFRQAAIASVVALVGVIGLTRIALGVHYPSDVVAGWLLGMLWLAVTASAFRRWRREEGLERTPLSGGLAPEDRPALVPAPAHDDALPQGWRSASELLAAAVVLWGALIGLGVLVTDVLGLVQQLDAAVVSWFAGIRTQTLTTAATLAGHLGGTLGIIAVLLVAVPVALAVTRRWRPPLFLLVAVVGETALFLATVAVIDRSRPDVPHLTPGLPPTSSFPSGHVAAALATYGAIALLAHAWGRGWLPRLLVVWALVAPLAVALSRLYRGVHYPSDVLASILFASAWLAACWFTLRPAGTADRGRTPEAASEGPAITPSAEGGAAGRAHRSRSA